MRERNVVTRWDMQLHCRFIIMKKHALDVFHLQPVRAPSRKGHGNMIPSIPVGCGNRQESDPCSWEWHAEYSVLVVSGIPEQR